MKHLMISSFVVLWEEFAIYLSYSEIICRY